MGFIGTAIGIGTGGKVIPTDVSSGSLVDPAMTLAATGGLTQPVAIWRADLGTVSDVGIKTWTDQVGGIVGTQATGSRQPTLTASDAAYNNHATLSFVAASLQFFATSGFSALSQPATVIVVGESTSGAGQQEFYASAGNTTGPYWAGAIWGAFAGGAISGGTTRAPMVGCVVFNGVSSAMYLNNSQTPTGSGNTGSQTVIPAFIGSSSAAGANALNGKIAELRFYAGALSAPSRLAEFANLGARYGISVS